jgi:hypothetical protein
MNIPCTWSKDAMNIRARSQTIERRVLVINQYQPCSEIGQFSSHSQAKAGLVPKAVEGGDHDCGSLGCVRRARMRAMVKVGRGDGWNAVCRSTTLAIVNCCS